MNRFFGMMPSNKIELEKHYKDNLGFKIVIQAGPEGYSIIYADHSTEYADINDTTENNFKTAYDIVTKHLGGLIEDDIY